MCRPNSLTVKETHGTLRAWETRVRTYFWCDTLFRKYFNAGECAIWNRNLVNCCFIDDVGGPALQL